MDYAFLEPWSGFLPRDPGHVLGFSGSGGKTGLMLAVADHYRAAGMPVVLTTTTRSEPLPGIADRLYGDLPLQDTLPPAVFIKAGDDGHSKWSGLAPDQVDALAQRLPDRIVLCEVDGAAKKALKLYREGEPVWPASTSLALVVMGTGAVGGSAGAGIHRVGAEGVSPGVVAALPAHTVLEWSHLQELLLGQGGYLDRVPRQVPVALALTQMDETADSIGLFAFAGAVMENPRLPLLVFSGRSAEGRFLRTAYRSGGAGSEPR